MWTLWTWRSFGRRLPGRREGDLPPGFEDLEGLVMWLGSPHRITELGDRSADTPPPTFMAAPLVCTPHYMDWGSMGLIRAYGGWPVLCESKGWGHDDRVDEGLRKNRDLYHSIGRHTSQSIGRTERSPNS